jgi:asparagine synthase (glutamine-hydrolysing)
MCGIAGIIFRDGQRPVDPSDLQAMAGALVHRGPDDEGSLIRGSAGFAMRRLSVIDVAGGRQPIWNEDRTVGVVQNGEIYNYLDLRADLQSRGHRFATASDTEAITHLYEEAGPSPELPSRLLGMFAFALYDVAREIIVLARDRAGKKPLFIYRDAGLISFASEMQALFAPRLPLDRSLDPAAIDRYLALQYVPGPQTIRARVRQLPPASILIVERGARGWVERPERRYWSMPPGPTDDAPSERGPRPASASFARATDRCEALLTDAVRRRLLSDVPVGAFLSGGLDSSLIAALMAREGGGTLRTFSIGFEDPDLDESWAALAVARSLGAEHRTLTMPSPGPDDLGAILARCDQPLADPAVIPTWYLSRLARTEVTVALSGEGADEVFAGYHWYRRRRSRRSAHPSTSPPDDDSLRSLLAPSLRAAIGDGADVPEDRPAPPGAPIARIAALQAEDFQDWMADDLLVKVDRMSMAHSLEVRCPYLDHRLVEAVLPGPDRWKIRWGRRKALLKAVARRYLPAAIVFRKKHGFQVPVDALLKTALRDLLADLASPARLQRRGILDPQGVASLLERWRDDRSPARQVWTVLCLLAWESRDGDRA